MLESASRQIELTIALTDLSHSKSSLEMAVTVTLPSADTLPPRPLVCFGKPGGSYSRGYFTVPLCDEDQVSQAQWHSERGWIFVAMDLMNGVSEEKRSSLSISLNATVEAAARAEQEILFRLENGTLCEGFPAVHSPLRIGLGHSLGGALSIVQQAHYRSFDGLVILGFSARFNRPQSPPGMAPIIVPWFARDLYSDEPEGVLNRHIMEEVQHDPNRPAGWEAYTWTAFYEDVPADIVEADLSRLERQIGGLAHSTDYSLPRWAASRLPDAISRSVLTPGFVATEAAVIDVPVLSAAGERDIVVDISSERHCYLSATSFDLFVCPKMGHMHNFAGTRELLWSRIDLFGQWLEVIEKY